MPQAISRQRVREHVRHLPRWALFGTVASALAFAHAPAAAAGFQLQNQNGAGTGLAYAGAAAVAEDASTIYFNPAGLTYLPMGNHLSLAGTVLKRSVTFSDDGTTRMPIINPQTNRPTGGFHALGSNGGNGGNTSLIPAVYFSYGISERLRAGLGLSVTYGSVTEYDKDFIGRFSGTYSSIKQLNLNPTIAYRFSDAISFGFGVNYAKSELEFRQATPFVNAPEAVLKGDDSAFGTNLGLMYQITPEARLGLSYRSKMIFKYQGKQTIAAPLNIDRSISAWLDTPANASLAFSYQLNPKTEILADATWTGWSSIQTLTATVDSSGATAATLAYNFSDSWRYGVGVKYQLDDRWNLRAGIAYDETPVPNEASRTMTLPDADRTWLSLGARYKIDEAMSLDVGYAHIFIRDAKTARAVTSGTTTLQTVRGTFKAHADILSVQLNYRF